MKRLLIVPLLLATVVLAGCPATEQDARDAIAAAHGWVVNAQTTWGASCRANATQLKCTTTNRLIAAEHTAADALTVYCSGDPVAPAKAYKDGGACVPVKSFAMPLVAAVQNMNQIIGDVKALFAKGVN